MVDFEFKYIPWMGIFLTAILSSVKNELLSSSQNNVASNDPKSELRHKTTQLETYHAYYTWIVDGTYFNISDKNHSALVESSTFSDPTNNDFKWFIRITSNNNESEETPCQIDILLSTESENRTVWAEFEMHFWNDNGTKELVWKSSEKSTLCALPKCSHGWSGNILEGDEFFSRKGLKISCNITFQAYKDFNKTSPQNYPISHQPIITELDPVSMQKSNSTIVFLVNGVEFHADKATIAARCPRLAAMFKNDTTKVNITGIEADVFDQMLRFISTGKCERVNEIADQLLLAALKYNLPHLKMICWHVLFKSGLTFENASFVYLLAVKYDIYGLRSDSFQFILANYDQVSNTSGWKNLVQSRPELVMIIEFCRTLWQLNDSLRSIKTKILISVCLLQILFILSTLLLLVYYLETKYQNSYHILKS